MRFEQKSRESREKAAKKMEKKITKLHRISITGYVLTTG